uniref:DUF7803 domain-containing protein n=1 Tax=Fagus sylvatica TaxID=28930 RepID=A0A2N9G4M8_FAGSY
MDVDSQPTVEETILVGDDLMMGPPSPLIPPEIASHVLEGVDLCDGILKNLFLCLQINDIEPFCQDEIAIYRECAEKRDKELRQRLQDSEHKLGLSMPLDEAKERSTQLESDITSLERRLILASGIEGMEGFRQRWSLHGRLTDTKRRLESLKQGMENRKKEEPVGVKSSLALKWASTSTLLNKMCSFHLVAPKAHRTPNPASGRVETLYDLKKSILHDLTIIRLATLWHNTRPLLSQ